MNNKHSGYKTDKEYEKYLKYLKDNNPESTLNKDLEFEPSNEVEEKEKLEKNIIRTRPLTWHQKLLNNFKNNIPAYVLGFIAIIFSGMFIDAKIRFAVLESLTSNQETNIQNNQNDIKDLDKVIDSLILSNKDDIVEIYEKINTIDATTREKVLILEKLILELENDYEVSILKNRLDILNKITNYEN